jgi:hypothetical protein
MSYQPLSGAEGLDDGDANAISPQASSKKVYGPLNNGRRFFKTSRSLHTAISVAAGTVMALFGYVKILYEQDRC